MACTRCITPMIKFLTEKLKIPSSNHAHKIVKGTLWVEVSALSEHLDPSELPLCNRAEV